MNRTEAKAYALDELTLEKDFVRTFGKLTKTQTWLDAIAAVEEATAEINTEDDVLVTLCGGGAEEPAETAEPNGEATEAGAEPSLEVLEDASASLAFPWETSEDSLLAFWESAPDQTPQPPLAVLPELDEAWGEPDSHCSDATAVVVYPIVILLMMLWAMVQVLLLSGKALCWVLTGVADRLDVMAQKRLQQYRESGLVPAGSDLTLAMP